MAMRNAGGRSRNSHATWDHDEIQQWAEERGAVPVRVKGTGGRRGGKDIGMIRLDFPGFSGRGSLEEITWNEWFENFDENNLALVHSDRAAGGPRSNFNKLVSRDSVESGSEGRSRPSGRARSTGGRSSSTRRGARAPSGSRARSRSTSTSRSRSLSASGRRSGEESQSGSSARRRSTGRRPARAKRLASRSGSRIRRATSSTPRSRTRRTSSTRRRRTSGSRSGARARR